MSKNINVSKHTPDYPEQLAYSPFVYQGVRFALGVSGTVYASAKGVPVRPVEELTFQDSGKPWIPKHRNFNALCRQMYRDGDVDEIVAEHKRLVARRKALRDAAPELLAEAEANAAILAALALHLEGFVSTKVFADIRERIASTESAIARATGQETSHD